MIYANLAEVARAKGDETAAQWQAKYDAKLAELEKLHGGESPETGIPPELAQALRVLASVANQCRGQAAPIPPEIAETLAQMKTAPEPFPAIAAYLQAHAQGQDVTLPAHIPKPIADLLTSPDT